MAVTVTCNPTAPRSTVDFCRVTVAGADQNDLTAYNTANYPTQAELRYYLTFEVGGVEKGRSYVFGVDETGGHDFNNYVFPSAGSFTIRLKNAGTNATVQSSSAITVS